METVREDSLSVSGRDSIREMFFFKMARDGTMYFAGKRSHAAYRRTSEKTIGEWIYERKKGSNVTIGFTGKPSL